MKRAIVTGAGGFIGTHLVRFLRNADYDDIRGVDLKPPQWSHTEADEFLYGDLRDPAFAAHALRGCQGAEVYHLAADMGGIGYILDHSAEIIRNNLHIDLNVIDVVAGLGCKSFVYSSSACVYPLHLQQASGEAPALREEQAWPAQPEDGYGLEKLTIEKMLQYYWTSRSLPARVARLHNIYGPEGTYDGGKEKAPAAICRKVALSPGAGSDVQIWGDGKQQRSYLYVADCCRGLHLIAQYSKMNGDVVNLGSDVAYTVEELLMLASVVAEKICTPAYVAGHQGVRARNCDSAKARQLLGWIPAYTFVDGLAVTYKWIEWQLRVEETNMTRTELLSGL